MFIEDIYFFEVNTKYISSSVLKTSEFHECAARVKISMFSTQKMKYIWYLPRKSKFSFYCILFRRLTANSSESVDIGIFVTKYLDQLSYSYMYYD